MFETPWYVLEIPGHQDSFMRYMVKEGGHILDLGCPWFEVDGSWQAATLASLQVLEDHLLPEIPGVREVLLLGRLANRPDLALMIILRMADRSPVLRFQYQLTSSRPDTCLTRSGDRDHLTLFSFTIPEGQQAREVRLSEFDEILHCYRPVENDIRSEAFANQLGWMGPILAWGDERVSMLTAYEHGSMTPDAFLEFRGGLERRVVLQAVKGCYPTGPVEQFDGPFDSPWMVVGGVAGGLAGLREAFRAYILHYQSQNAESRTPYIFYNTWNFQERNNAWNGRPYLESMNSERILSEVDAAHRMGIDVFVLDTGWYERTGDWQVSQSRFPDGLFAVKQKLQAYGMKLGVWLSPTQAAVSSRAGLEYLKCRIDWDGAVGGPYPVWETEASWNMCVVSRYWEAFADEMIRLAREMGVTYFKWDAIGQYGCNSAEHYHGGPQDSAAHRADRYAFELPRYLGKVVKKVCQACPEVIVDFDITEGGRSVGLGFLESGKFFLINNGPYFRSLDFPADTTNLGMFWNVFVYPGPARAQLCRAGLEFDAWIPAVLFLTHYLPDPPQSSQLINIASLVLGQNGIWGDLLGLADSDLALFGEILGVYKHVRADITAAYPVVTGIRGGSPEIYEKIHTNGRGVVVIFSSAGGHFTYVTQANAARVLWCSPNCAVTPLANGQARLDIQMEKQTAALVFFG